MTISRTRFLARSATAVAGMGVALFPSVAHAARRRRVVFRLDSSSDAGCRACRNHAANTYFATRKEVRRAHVGCQCAVVSSTLPEDVWIALFGHPALLRRTRVDRRRSWVRALLRHAA